MSKKLTDLIFKRNNAVKLGRDILEKAETEKRGLTTEEQANYDKNFDDIESIRKAIQNEERQIAAERESTEQELRNRGGGDDDDEEIDPTKPENRAAHKRGSKEYNRAFRTYMLRGAKGLNEAETRALQSDIDSSGGSMVAPIQMVDMLIKFVDDEVFIRAKATKFRVPTAQSLGAPSLDADPADADWTSEILTGSEDSTMAFGKRELHPHPLAKRIKVSNKLLRQVPNVDSFVMSRLGYKFAISQEKAYLLGTGVNQPLGLMVASANGITTARDVSTDNTSTAITMDGLINAKYAVKSQYQRIGEWLFHRDAIKMIAKLKDTTNQYLWEPSKKVGDPDMLLGRPLAISEYMPNTFTTGLYVGLFGDFSQYWIADAEDMKIQSLFELYAETNQVGLIGRLESDAMPVLAEAFARVKLG